MGKKAIGKMRPDEAGPACNEDFHALRLASSFAGGVYSKAQDNVLEGQEHPHIWRG